jgi:hypothetical protein
VQNSLTGGSNSEKPQLAPGTVHWPLICLLHDAERITRLDRPSTREMEEKNGSVATSVLSPGQIGSPIPGILGNQKNTTVILGEVTGVDKDRKCVFVTDADREGVPIPYSSVRNPIALPRKTLVINSGSRSDRGPVSTKSTLSTTRPTSLRKGKSSRVVKQSVRRGQH